MIGVSLSPVVAWELLHCDRRVLNLPEPAPMPPTCDRCNGGGRLMQGAPKPAQGKPDTRWPCPTCGGSGVGLLRVAIHTTNEWPDDGPTIHGDPLVTPDRKGVAGVLGDGSSADHVKFMPFDSVVAIATITGSHEATCPDAECHGGIDVPTGQLCPTCKGSETVGHDWVVGSVEPINPIPWARAYCCLDHALCDVEIPGHQGAQAREEFERLASLDDPQWCGDEMREADPVWELPADLTNQLENRSEHSTARRGVE